MKTIREWLEELPVTYRNKALEYLSDYMGDDECNSMVDALGNAFVWADTEEGHVYWEKVRTEYLTTSISVGIMPHNALTAIYAIALRTGIDSEEILGTQQHEWKDDAWYYRVAGSGWIEVDFHNLNQ